MSTIKRKIKVPKYIDLQKVVLLKSMGNIKEIAISDKHNSGATVKPISKDKYLLYSTGEVKKFENHALDRTENLRNLQKTMHCLSDLINANIYSENADFCKFITFTYRENMQDSNKLYIDFRNFNKRFKRYMEKLGHHYEYIITVEAQERGALHLHGIFIFSKKAPYIENSVLADMWGLGYVSIKAFDKNIDNIGKYLTSYLADLPIDNSSNIVQELMGGDIKEISVNDNRKRIIKGARLKLLPVGMRIYRYSRGIRKPKVKSISYGEALKELSDSGFSKVNEYAIEIKDIERDFTSQYIKQTFKKNINTNKKVGDKH